jgi:hypothetical protein
MRLKNILWEVLFAIAILLFLGLFLNGYICETATEGCKEQCASHNLTSVILWYIGNWFTSDRINAISTAIIAGFTVMLAITTKKLWDAGEKQLKLSQDTAQRQLRAYVFAVDPSFVSLPVVTLDEERRIRIEVKLRNSGSTPTRHLVIGAHFTERTREVSADFTFPEPVDSQHVLIGPNSEIIACSITMPYEIIDRIKNETSFLYIWGYADYNDVFEKTPRHTLEWFFRVSVADDAEYEGHWRAGFESVPHHPIAIDEDAKRKAKPYK